MRRCAFAFLRAVVVVLDRDLGERLAARARRCACSGWRRARRARARCCRAPSSGWPRRGRPRPPRSFSFSAPTTSTTSCTPDGDREAGVAEGVGAGGAVVLDPRDRPAVEAQRVGRATPPTSRRPGPGRYVPRYAASISLGIDAGVVVGRERGVADQLLVAAVVALAELRAADADDGDLVLHAGLHLPEVVAVAARLVQAAERERARACRPRCRPRRSRSPWR